MRVTLLVLLVGLAGLAEAQPRVEKERVVSITSADLKGGILSEITWDGGLLLLQGVFIEPTGALKPHYVVVPAEGTELKHLSEQPPGSTKYWELKSNRVSPTGLGRIEAAQDAKMPMYGVGSHDQRLRDAVDMGGTQQLQVLKLGKLLLHERTADALPYDGEVYSWSPPTLNRLAYVDGKGDLWVASADGTNATRLFRGEFTLPAWSDDGRLIAVAERKERGRRWDVSVIHLPEELRSPPR